MTTQVEKHQFTFRPATADDAETVSALVNSGYRGDVSKQGWTTEADLLGGQRTDAEDITKLVAKDGNVLLLCFKDNVELYGCVFIQKKDDTRAYLGMLTVRPDKQGLGLGKIIIDHVHNFVENRWNIRSLEMSVIMQRPELIQFYERRGFKDTGRREPFPYGDAKFGLPKVKGLEFGTMEKTW